MMTMGLRAASGSDMLLLPERPGLLVRETALAESVESTMTSKHGTLYELA